MKEALLQSATEKSLFAQGPNFLERFRRLWPREKSNAQIKPASPTPQELSQAEERSFSWLHSDRYRVVVHLHQHSEQNQSIIARYLESQELLQDSKTLGDFLTFAFLEFFQQQDSGILQALPYSIQTAKPEGLPRNLQSLKKEVFDPLFRLLRGQEETIFQQVGNQGLFACCERLAQTVIEVSAEAKRPLPPSLIKEYQRYVSQLVQVEAGITKPPQLVQEKEKNKKPAAGKSKKPSPKSAVPPESSSTPKTAENEANFRRQLFICLGLNSEPVPVASCKELAGAMKSIPHLGPVTPEIVWQQISQIATLPPLEIVTTHRELVQGGPFKNWHEKRFGEQWLMIFTIEKDRMLFRIGNSHDNIFGTKRRKPKDSARSL